MGQIRYCLGINFEVTEQGISLCQKQYLMKLLERYKLTEAKTVNTPTDLNVKLVKDDSYSEKVDTVQHQSMVGSLLHAARATRPYIAHAVGVVSKFNAATPQVQLREIKQRNKDKNNACVKGFYWKEGVYVGVTQNYSNLDELWINNF